MYKMKGKELYTPKGKKSGAVHVLFTPNILRGESEKTDTLKIHISREVVAAKNYWTPLLHIAMTTRIVMTR
jgi:hypothetical protein